MSITSAWSWVGAAVVVVISVVWVLVDMWFPFWVVDEWVSRSLIQRRVAW